LKDDVDELKAALPLKSKFDWLCLKL